MPKSAAISESDDAMPAAPQSCSDSTRPDETSSTDDSMSFLPVNGSPICTDGRFSAGRIVQLLAREHRGAADAVAAGRRAVEDDELAGDGRLRAHEPVDREQPDAHRVDEAVVAVGLVEDRLAADGRDADAVPVVADAADGAREVTSRAPRSAGRRGARSGARPSRRCRGGFRPLPSPRPGTARPPRGGCGSRP